MNQIFTTVCGNVATDPKEQVTRTGQPMATFRLGSTARRYDRELQGFVDQDTTWVNVTCFGGLAQNALASLEKGHPVVVHGELRVRDWKADDGRTGREVDVVAQALGHDLRRGCGTFRKVTRTGPPASAVGPGRAPETADLQDDPDDYDPGASDEDLSLAGYDRDAAEPVAV